MDGVIILNSHESLTNFGSIFLMTVLCVWFFAVAAIILLSLLKHECGPWKGAIVIIICVALSIVCGCLIPEDEYETHYQVIVDNSVSMNEFQNKYEIIEVEGKIYTVRERVE